MSKVYPPAREDSHLFRWRDEEIEMHTLLDSPIAELAEYLGTTVDQAVKVRVTNAVEAAKQAKIEVTVRPIETRGTCTVLQALK